MVGPTRGQVVLVSIHRGKKGGVFCPGALVESRFPSVVFFKKPEFLILGGC